MSFPFVSPHCLFRSACLLLRDAILPYDYPVTNLLLDHCGTSLEVGLGWVQVGERV